MAPRNPLAIPELVDAHEPEPGPLGVGDPLLEQPGGQETILRFGVEGLGR
jgi:hypothetical protein